MKVREDWLVGGEGKGGLASVSEFVLQRIQIFGGGGGGGGGGGVEKGWGA